MFLTAYACHVVDGAAAADDARGVLGLRSPERHLGDSVGLRNDPLSETGGFLLVGA